MAIFSVDVLAGQQLGGIDARHDGRRPAAGLAG